MDEETFIAILAFCTFITSMSGIIVSFILDNRRALRYDRLKEKRIVIFEKIK